MGIDGVEQMMNLRTTAKFAELLRKTEPAFEPIRKRLTEMMYPEWETCVNEHIVRAITVRLAHREFGYSAGRKASISENRRGFKYVNDIAKLLARYGDQRTQYPTLADFYPEIFDAIGRRMKE